MTTPKAAAFDWIETAIREERPGWHPDEISAAARELHAIAIDYDVPVEELVRWIHEDNGTDAAAWAGHCLWYIGFRARLCSEDVH